MGTEKKIRKTGNTYLENPGIPGLPGILGSPDLGRLLSKAVLSKV